MKIDSSLAFPELLEPQKDGPTGVSPTQKHGQELQADISVCVMTRLDTRQCIELLKRRVASLRLMARELCECRESFTSLDLEGIREHVLYQKSLCSEIRALDDELRVLWRQLAAASGLPPEEMSLAAFDELCDADSSWQLRQVMNDLEVVQKRVRRLNRVYAGLLSRSRRSINVLIHVMANYIGTYSPSPAESAWSFPW